MAIGSRIGAALGSLTRISGSNRRLLLVCFAAGLVAVFLLVYIWVLAGALAVLRVAAVALAPNSLSPPLPSNVGHVPVPSPPVASVTLQAGLWEFIIDTDDGLDLVASIGNWPFSINVPGHHGAGYRTNALGNGYERFTWKILIPVAGRYEVFAWWTAAYDRATNAPYIVSHADGVSTVRVDQTRNGSRWWSLGSYRFKTGATTVTLSDDANGYVIADALRFAFLVGKP